MTDDGPGIAAEMSAACIREVRARAQRDNGRGDGGEGTGLGLAIAKGIMEAHGGIDRRPKARWRTGAAPASLFTFPREEAPP